MTIDELIKYYEGEYELFACTPDSSHDVSAYHLDRLNATLDILEGIKSGELLYKVDVLNKVKGACNKALDYDCIAMHCADCIAMRIEEM